MDHTVTAWTKDGLYTIECVGPAGEVRQSELGGCPDLFHAYSRYPIATPVLSVPFFLLIDRLAPLTPAVTPGLELLAQRRYSQVFRIVEIWIASLWIGLAAGFLFLSIPARGQAWFWTAAFAFGTGAWSTASRALWHHAPSIFFLSAALYFLTTKHRRVVLAGVLLGLAVWNRPLQAIPLLCLALWLRRDGLRLLAAAAAVSIPFVLYCLAVYRMPVPPYFQQSGAYVWDLSRAGAALFGQLASPARGLFVYTPFLLLMPLGAARLWRKDRGLVLAVTAWFAIYGAAISFFADWTAGMSYGPRYWSDFLPGAMLLVVPIWPARRAVAALVLLAVLLNARGATSNYVQTWGRRWVAGETHVWDWKKAPFLGGITW